MLFRSSDNNTTTSGQGDGCAVLAALNVTAPGGNANWSNNFQYSTNSENDSDISTANNSYPINGANGGSGTGATYIYNSWGNWAPKFADDKWLLAFDAVLGAFSPSGGPASGGTTWYGAGLYTKYQFNDWFYLAGRGEYFGSDNQNKTGITTPNTGNGSVSWWEYTITAGFNVIDNLLIRAEYRLDWGTNINGGSNAPSGQSGGPAHYAGAEVVYSF